MTRRRRPARGYSAGELAGMAALPRAFAAAAIDEGRAAAIETRTGGAIVPFFDAMLFLFEFGRLRPPEKLDAFAAALRCLPRALYAPFF